jgi:alkaline phosphatase D
MSDHGGAHDTGRLGRRSLLLGTAAAGSLVSMPTVSLAASRYFKHGVASGDPYPDSVVLWTRVTPTARAKPGSGKGPQARVSWQVARDRRFTQVVARGTFVTGPARDHTVKVLASGLAPRTTYYYRFGYRGSSSPVGRTRTAPDNTQQVAHLRFGVVSCSNLQAGFFAAYRHLAARDDLDAVLHLGDYLYEYGPGQYGYGYDNVDVRRHVPPHETRTLADYRRRHAQYKRDPDLRALHARLPLIVCWDDHDVANDAHRKGAQNHSPRNEGRWTTRRRMGHRAFDEWMPVRLGGTARMGDGAGLYRALRFGSLADLSMLDLRSYRTRQARWTRLEAVDRPGRTITGDEQMAWLKQRLASSDAQWKLVGNPVMISPVTFPPLPGPLRDRLRDVAGFYPADGAPINVDQWDGYTADRRELLSHIRNRSIGDVVFLTGDIHSAWACEVPVARGTYPGSGTVGTEFVCTSVTSNNLDDITNSRPRAASLVVEASLQALNRHVKFVNLDDHGFSLLDITPQRLQMDYYAVHDRRRRRTRASWVASWATPAGSGRVQAVANPVSRGAPAATA